MPARRRRRLRLSRDRVIEICCSPLPIRVGAAAHRNRIFVIKVQPVQLFFGTPWHYSYRFRTAGPTVRQPPPSHRRSCHSGVIFPTSSIRAAQGRKSGGQEVMLGASVKDDPGAAANRTSRSTRASKSTARAADLRPGYWKRGGQLGEGGRRAGGCRKQDLRGGGGGAGGGAFNLQ